MLHKLPLISDLSKDWRSKSCNCNCNSMFENSYDFSWRKLGHKNQLWIVAYDAHEDSLKMIFNDFTQFFFNFNGIQSLCFFVKRCIEFSSYDILNVILSLLSCGILVAFLNKIKLSAVNTGSTEGHVNLESSHPRVEKRGS